MQLRPIDHPSAWTAAELAEDRSWVVELTENDKAEALAALERVGGWAVESIGCRDFGLPSLGPRLDAIIDEIEGGRGVALIRGVPIGGLALGDIERLFWGLATHLGYPEAQDATGKRLHHVRAQQTVADRDQARQLFAGSNLRAYQTNIELGLHGDGSDALFFLCVRQGKTGGATRISSATSAFNDLLAQDPTLVAALRIPVAFDTRGETGPDRPYQVAPVFALEDGQLSMLYKRGYIELAQRLPGAPPLTPQQIAAMDALDQLIGSEKNCFSFDLAPGDILIANNYNVLHARTAFEDWPAPAPGRLMLRIWSTLRRNRRKLPPSYRTSREFAEAQRRRELLGDPA